MTDQAETIQQRARAARLSYFADFAIRRGLTEAQALRVAALAETLFVQGLHMSADRLAMECELAQRRAA